MLEKLNMGLRIIPAIFKAKYIKPVPIFCQWEVIYNCNMDCKFCAPKRNIELKKKYPELNTNEAINVIKQLDSLGTRIINFSGGEPTLRKDLPVLIDKIKKRKMAVFLSTNGSTLKYTAKNLLKADMIRVSIDGPKEVHDKLRRHPNAFDKAIKGIKILKGYGKKPMIVTAVSNLIKFKDLVYLVELAKSLEVQIDFSMVMLSLPATVNPKKSSLLKEQKQLISDKKWFIESIVRLKKTYGKTIANPYVYLEMLKKGGLSHLGCKSSTVNIIIKPNGMVGLPCDVFTLKMLKGNLKDIYFNEEVDRIRKLTGKYWFCKSCFSRCNGFPSMLLKTKQLMSLVKSYKSF